MPRPTGGSSTYVPGIDGLRALSVIAVVGYHLGVPSMSGGFLGVGMFFTLSGYLITGILLRSWRKDGRLDLRQFWLRRARRLLPGVVLLVTAVLLTTAIAQPDQVRGRLVEAIAALAYVSNWATISAGVSYFDRFNGPGPFDHLWSLAIEEQFYILWPLALMAMLRLCRGKLRYVIAMTAAAATLSFVLLAVLASPGFDNTRAYEGTDTRAGGILIGALMAMVWSPGQHTSKSTWRERAVLDGSGVAALGVIAWLVVVNDQYSMWTYRGGLALLSLATAVLVAVVAHPRSLVGRAVGTAPFRWVGERSYGIYLWHLPLVALMPEAFMASQPVLRGVLLIGLTLLTAELSWVLIEDPIRIHGFRGALRLQRTTGDRSAAPALASSMAWTFVGVFVVAILSAASLVGRGPDATALAPAMPTDVLRTSEPSPSALAPSPGSTVGLSATAGVDASTATGAPTATGTTIAVSAAAPAASPRAAGAPRLAPGAATPRDAAPPPRPPAMELPVDQLPADLPPDVSTRPATTPSSPAPVALRTACASVAHVGDSTSIGLMSPDYLPEPQLRIDAQYHEVGVGAVQTDIAGARSIVETFQGQPNAETAALDLRAAGHDGCWVFAMGTNEAANFAAGSAIGGTDRIEIMMAAAAGRPVLWPTVRTLVTSGPYAEPGMAEFDAQLREACARHANLRIFDWAAEARDEWYQPDGIHFTSEGYAERGRRIARALAVAFPAGAAPSRSCVIASEPATAPPSPSEPLAAAAPIERRGITRPS